MGRDTHLKYHIEEHVSGGIIIYGDSGGGVNIQKLFASENNMTIEVGHEDKC